MNVDTTSRIRSLPLGLVAVASVFSLTLISSPRSACADPVSELASFSIFDKVDLGQLAKSDVKTAHGPPMKNSRFLAVQSCYVAPGSPAQQIEALRRWNPTKYRELKVFLHSDLPSNPGPANFEKLKNAPDNASVRSFVTATQKLGSELQISKDEAKRSSSASGAGGGGAIPPAVVAFWTDVLTARTKSFVSGGTAAQPPYDHAGPSIRASDEVNGLLREQGKIRQQFSGLLGATGIGRGAGSLPAELYWELLDVNDHGVVTLGASYNRGGTAGTYQTADVLYYASGGYYVALTLHQLWPVTMDGKPSTLVWRGDMISSAELGSLHGVERLGSESVMMKNITKAVTLFRRETGR
ncbi:MAG TPA: hypothetical protein VHT01_06575 [Candidatus Udaeobacter sp.]|jgi:hypothetical protein|nr:hypothetical protein [Candidatus Udaeobacter sp.]